MPPGVAYRHKENEVGLYRILYSSSALQPFSLDELTELLHEAREGNARHGITGLLLYHNQSFMQVIEGEEQQVRHLYYHGIFHDDRHTAVHALIEEPIEARRFDGWVMGFKLIDETLLDGEENFIPLPEQGLTDDVFKDDPDMADRLMKSFSVSDI